MKNLGLIATAALLLTSQLASADDYPQRVAAKASSLSMGMAVSSAPVLSRASADQKAVQAGLLSALGLDVNNATLLPNSTGTRLKATGWTLDIRGDGTSAEYVDLSVRAAASSKGVAHSARMTPSSLESAARAFISSKLAKFVVLQSGEELVPVTTAYRFEGGQDLKTGIVSDVVVTNRVVLGRTIHGVPVVGGGSTVTVTFDNAGALESFRYDWPTYASGALVQTALAPSDLLGRVQAAVSSRSSVAITASVKTSASYPVDLLKGTQLVALECGYYDPGVLARDAKALVQMGCVYHATMKTPGPTPSDTVTSGYAGAVPAALNVQNDLSWPETLEANGISPSSPMAPGQASTLPQ
jgi:hypothetical protein